MAIKDKYEISLWVDRNEKNEFVEHKIAIIGSDTMSSPFRALEPVLTENVNGTHTFTFKMIHRCKDQEVGELYLGDNYFPEPYVLEELYPALRANPTFDEIPPDGFMNPFILLLQNERKVKVKWKNQWYDLLIKECEESSDKNVFTYKCTDMYINELAKNGYGITFDNELMNNQGTAQQLATRVVDGTEWQVPDIHGNILEVESSAPTYDDMVVDSGRDVPEDLEDIVVSDKIYQENEEPVIPVSVISDFEAVNDETGETETIPAGSTILAFYPPLADLDYVQNGTFDFQFAYNPNGYPEEGKSILVDADSYTVHVFYQRLEETDNIIFIVMFNASTYTINLESVSPQWRATRYQDSQKCVFVPTPQKYCYIYSTDPNGLGDVNDVHTVYYYRDTSVDGATAVVNLLANPVDFVDYGGWMAEWSNKNTPLRLELSPKGSGTEMFADAHSYLRISNESWFYNSGLTGMSSFLPDGWQSGTEYILRYKIYNGSDAGPGVGTAEPEVFIGLYDDSEYGVYTFGSSIMTQVGSTATDSDGYRYRKYRVTQSIPRSQLSSYNGHKVGFFIKAAGAFNWIKEIQFFICVVPEDPNNPGHPSGEPFIAPNQLGSMALANIRHNYYYPAKNKTAKKIEDIAFMYQGAEPYSGSTTLYPINNEFEKIRSIEGKQSNRFNLLQTIAEKFDCWVCFYINHNETGYITKLDGEHLDKYVYFKRELGVHKDFGFIYGIDLQSIKRTVQSDTIVTRTIVNPNSNEFAPYGSCNIVRASNNYSKSNAILNFGYYVNEGLLNGDVLTKDLYSGEFINPLDESEGRYINYYGSLRKLYTQYDLLIDRVSRLTLEKSKLEGYVELYEASYISANSLITNYISQICLITGVDTSDINDSRVQQYIETHSTTENIRELLLKWRQAQSESTNFHNLETECETTLRNISAELEALKEQQLYYLDQIKKKEEEFFKKYSTFIQEGYWQDEKYMDDELYYLDGLEVAYTSSRPQISYEISVLRLSALEEYQNKVFGLGDLTWIQDKEFFGYYIDKDTQAKTPIKEQVLISELTSYFEEPEKDKFTVQNYQTIYDNLFQRITAATQSLQFHEGEYARAANSFTTEGALKPKAIQMAFDENKDLLLASNNNKIIQNENGITLYSYDDPSRQVRINANGLFITSDNGLNWKNAIKSTGVATETLTAGSINTELITIFSNDQPTFGWTSTGLTAYGMAYDPTMDGQVALHNKFVRFDQFGIYGVDKTGESNWYTDWVGHSVEDIKANAKFGLLWGEFFLKQEVGNGSIEISSNTMRMVFNDGRYDRLEIGSLTSIGRYGIIIRDADGQKAFYVDDNGQLKIGGFEVSEDGLEYYKPNDANHGSIIMTPTHFRVGNDNAYIDWNGTTLELNGNINAQYINLTGAHIGRWEVTNQGLYDSTTGATITPDTLSYGSNFNISSIYDQQTHAYQYSQASLDNGQLGDWRVVGDTLYYSDQSSGKYVTLSPSNFYMMLQTGSEMSYNTTISPYTLQTTGKWGSFSVGGGNTYGSLTVTFTNSPYVTFGMSTSNGVGSCTFGSSLGGYTFLSMNISGGVSYTETTLNSTVHNIALYAYDKGVLGGSWYYGSESTDNEIVKKSDLSNVPLPSTASFTQLQVTNSRYTSLFAFSVGEQNGGTLSGAWTLPSGSAGTGSDKRYKNTILSLDNKYGIFFDNLRSVTFKYNEGTSNRLHVGFIAQEVEDALTTANLSTQEFAGFIYDETTEAMNYYLRYEEFIALNTWQIQLLKARVSQLEAELRALKGE